VVSASGHLVGEVLVDAVRPAKGRHRRVQFRRSGRPAAVDGRAPSFPITRRGRSRPALGLMNQGRPTGNVARRAHHPPGGRPDRRNGPPMARRSVAAALAYSSLLVS
jgi:hypothetical protein